MATFKHKLAAHLPGWQEIFPVFSLIIFIVFTWTIYRMAWELQSWLYSNTLPQILILAAYVLAFALIESLVVMAFVLLFGLILPNMVFRDHFVAQGSIMVAILTLIALVLQHYPDAFTLLAPISLLLIPLALVAWLIILLVGSAYFLERKRSIITRIQNLTDRLTVFSYIYIPLSLVGLLVVIIRNTIR